MMNTIFNWFPWTKLVVISKVIQKQFADISSLTGAYPSEKAKLTPYREGIISGIVYPPNEVNLYRESSKYDVLHTIHEIKVSAFVIGLPYQDQHLAYTEI